MRALVLERAEHNSNEPSTTEKEMLVKLINFIYVDIFEIEKCKLFVEYSQGKEGVQIPEGFSKLDCENDFFSVARFYFEFQS